MSTFGDLLRTARRQKKATLLDLANLADCSIAYISQIERNLRNPPNQEIINKWISHLNAYEMRDALYEAARKSVKKLNVSTIGKNERATNVLTALARRYESDTLSEDEIAELERLLERKNENDHLACT